MMADLVRLLVMLVLSVSLSEVTADDDCHHPWVVLGHSCMRVVLAQRDNNSGAPIPWQQARQQCQQLAPGQAADLAVMADSHTLADFSRYVNKTFPDETSSGWVYWVGGEKIIRKGTIHWQWVNGIKLDVISHLWLPSSPTVHNNPANTLLVPADKTHGRFYINDLNEGNQAPAFVCQLREDDR